MLLKQRAGAASHPSGSKLPRHRLLVVSSSAQLAGISLNRPFFFVSNNRWARCVCAVVEREALRDNPVGNAQWNCAGSVQAGHLLVRQAVIVDLAGAHQDIEAAQYLFHRRDVVAHVRPERVDVIGVQAFEAFFDRPHHVLAVVAEFCNLFGQGSFLLLTFSDRALC